MTSTLSNWLCRLQIKVLIFLNPPKLFEKINQLEWYQNMLHEWIESQNLKPNTKVLEIGSATGELSHYLEQKAFIPTGIDTSKRMIDLAKSKYNQINFHVANAYALPFGNASFDAIIASSLINVVDDKAKALSEMLRVCKNDGIVTFLVPLKGFDDKNLNGLNQKLQLIGFSKAALYMWHKSATKMSLEEIKTLIETTPFQINSEEKYLDNMIISISLAKT